MTTERDALRATAAEFTRREVVPHLQEWEDAGEIPRALHRTAGDLGLIGIAFPESVGGSGGDLLDSVAMQEAMFDAGASSGLMAGLFTSGIALPHIAACGNADLVDRFVRPTLAGELIGSLAITEPGGGSDVARITHPCGARRRPLRRRRREDLHHLRRPGRLRHDRRPHRRPGARRASRCWSSRRARPASPSTGRCARWAGTAPTPPSCPSSTCRVPVANLVGDEGSGFGQIADQFVVERIALAVHGYGIAARSLDLAAAYARDRQTFGRPLIGNQSVQHTLVEMRRQVEVARTYTRHVAARHVAGEFVVAEACLAKQTAVDCAAYVCDRAVQLFGGTGYMHGTEVERHYRDARILPIGGGADEVLRDLTAKLMGYGS